MLPIYYSVADTLSRATINDVQLGIDYGAMASAQQQDAEVQAYHTSTSSFQLEDISFGTQGVTLLCPSLIHVKCLLCTQRYMRVDVADDLTMVRLFWTYRM